MHTGVRLITFILLSMAIESSYGAFNNTYYVISNAETPSLRLPGLTPVGQQRAQTCIPSVFSSLNVGKIISCLPDKDSGNCFETIATATPLANALGLPIDTTCGADEETDDDCVVDLMKKFGKNSTQTIVIIWDLNAMDDLFENLDVDDGDDDDDDDDDDETPHFDLVTQVKKSKVQAIFSQNCTGIDGQAPGTFRRSLKRSAIEKRKVAKAKSSESSRNRMAKRRHQV
ncbi:hypothetical protein BDQ17DRAFT_1369138 [Cyathus striatus]|nr:hypothetical protein BDQ17DRAFT_1369138 [Cyathus striatus]